MAETPPEVCRDRLKFDRPDTILLFLLAFLIPGTGHALLGQLRKGLSFFAIIGLMFVTGIMLDGRLYEIDFGRPLSVIATLASQGSGLLDLAARFIGWTGDGYSRTYEYGTAFILTSGIMNLLLLFDVWEELAAKDGEQDARFDADEEDEI